jgi:hypothetical protein
MKRVPLDTLLLAALSVAGGLLLTGCNRQQNSAQINFQMGDRITAGPVVYNVIQTMWRTQMGDIFKTRVPENRFLMITISATNGSGSEISVPLLTLEGDKGKEYHELENGDGVNNWFGLMGPASLPPDIATSLGKLFLELLGPTPDRARRAYRRFVREGQVPVSDTGVKRPQQVRG